MGKRKAMSKVKQEKEDRLSSLPDNLLITIISFLNITSAAATSVLSRRWHNLWTHTTNLSVDKISLPNLHHIISQLESPKIHTFHLHHIIPLFQNPLSPSDLLLPSIRHICRRNPQVINLNLCYSPRPTVIFLVPHCLFQTQSLVQLVLRINLEFNFLANPFLSFNLPNLVNLTLVLFESNCALVANNRAPLLSACPLLKDLNLTFWFVGHDHVVDISTPLLKRLRIDVNASKTQGCKFVINAPVLEECHIGGDLMFYEFITIPSNLQTVMINIQEASFDDANDDDINIKLSKLFQGVSCVRQLISEESAINLFNYMNCISRFDKLPIFRNLIHLSFSNYVDTWTIKELPSCFLFNKLQRVDVRDLQCQAIEFHLLQHILTNANTLSQLHISVFDEANGVGGDQLRKEYEFCKKIFMISKTSINCQVEFFGLTIIASCKDFRDGILTCQIRDH